MADLVAFVPENPLEDVIEAARAGKAAPEDIIQALTRSPLMVPSLKDTEGGKFSPLLMGESGDEPYVAVCTAASRQDLHSQIAPFTRRMDGRDFFLRMPRRYGVIINPGYETQLVIPAFGVEDIKAKLQYGQL